MCALNGHPSKFPHGALWYELESHHSRERLPTCHQASTLPVYMIQVMINIRRRFNHHTNHNKHHLLHILDTQSLPLPPTTTTDQQQQTMESIPENIALSDLPHYNRRSNGTHSAPSRLQHTISPRHAPAHQAATITPSTVHYHADRSRTPSDASSSTCVAVPIPHLGSVSRVPRRLQRCYPQHPPTQTSHDANERDNSSSISNSSRQERPPAQPPRHPSNTATIPPRPPPSNERRARSSSPLAPSPRNPEPSPHQRAASRNIAETGSRKPAEDRNAHKHVNSLEIPKSSLLKRCVNSFLECWFGWEDGDVYYGGSVPVAAVSRR
jgi:hypothetical protein